MGTRRGVVATDRRENRAAGSPAGGLQDAMTVRFAMTQPMEGQSVNGHRVTSKENGFLPPTHP